MVIAFCDEVQKTYRLSGRYFIKWVLRETLQTETDMFAGSVCTSNTRRNTCLWKTWGRHVTSVCQTPVASQRVPRTWHWLACFTTSYFTTHASIIQPHIPRSTKNVRLFLLINMRTCFAVWGLWKGERERELIKVIEITFLEYIAWNAFNLRKFCSGFIYKSFYVIKE